MEVFIALIIGITAGAVTTSIRYRTQSVGALRVERSDPSEPPYLFLELNQNPETLINRTYVVLDVRDDYISHE